jgi:hypothetical protein
MSDEEEKKKNAEIYLDAIEKRVLEYMASIAVVCWVLLLILWLFSDFWVI